MLAACFLSFASFLFGQYNSNVQGTIFDPSGQLVADAAVRLRNTGTGITNETKSNNQGLYRFVNVAPGDYIVTVEAKGFERTEVKATLTTRATSGVDVSLKIAGAATTVTVQENASALNPDETRLQTTLSTSTIESLPLQNNSIYAMIQAAPGVTGFIDSRNTDNFTNEHTLDLSANGTYYGGNAYILDGISVVSNIITGEVNISPNPDSIQEAALQTNSFSAQYGNSSSVVDELTSKSGTNSFHGSGNYLFTNQMMSATTKFIHSYSPFKRHDVAGAFGGPIIKNKTFFFASTEMKRSSSQGLSGTVGSSQSAGVVKFEDPAFTSWAQSNFPNTHGTFILNQYKPTAVQTLGIVQWANPNYTKFCSSPVSGCNTPFVDEGVPTATPYNNGLQYNFRGDQYFHEGRDRIFANFYRTTDDFIVDDIRPQFDTPNTTLNWFASSNYSHTFSPNLTNMFAFGAFAASGATTTPNLVGSAGGTPAPMPFLSTNAEGISFGGNAWGPATFIQHNYEWNDMVNYIRGKHTFKIGVDVYHGDDSANFSGPRARPSYAFSDLTNFVQDQVFSESGVTFSPLTGQFSPNKFGIQNTRIGSFVQDEWKLTPRLLLSLGLRWDNFGNPSPYGYPDLFPKIDNIYLPATGSLDERFTNAVIRGSNHLFRHSQANNWSPRIGFAWSPGQSSSWTIRGGVGLYRTPVTLGQALDSLDLNPPNWIFPTFGGQQQVASIYSFGNSNKVPFGFTYPTIPATGVNPAGGLIGVASSVNGVNPDLSIAKTLVYQFATEKQLGKSIIAGVNFSGSHGYGLLSGNTDYNRYPLLQ